MADFAKLAATAKRLIEANGRTLTLRKRNRTPESAAQPWRGPAATPATAASGVTLSVVGVVVPVTGTGLGSVKVVGDTLTQRFEQAALIASASLPTGVDLKEFGTLVDGDRAWTIARVQELRPASTSVIYALGLVG